MNSKLAKALRKQVRQMLPNVPERGHTTPAMNMRLMPDYSALNPDGTQKMVPFYYTGTVRNERNTQRALYRSTKRMWKLAEAR